MKVLLISDYFPPEVGSASHLFYEFGTELVRRDIEVKVLTGFPRYNIRKKDLEKKYRRKLFMKEEVNGMTVHRVKRLSLPRAIRVLRGLDQFITAFIFFWRAFFMTGYDVVLIYSPPLPLGLTGFWIRILRWKKVVFNVQDLFPQSPIDLGVMNNKLIIGFFRFIEKIIYKHVNWVTVHSPGNLEYVKARSGKDNISVHHNWVNSEEICPGSKENDFAEQYDLKGKFIINFAGVLGISQDLDVIVEAAEKLKDVKDIYFIIVGDGLVKERIQALIDKKGLKNVQMIPMQSKERYPMVLQASDLGLVTLKETVKTPVVPSKLLSIMSAGIPVIAAVSLDGDTPKIIKESGCGICIEPENSEVLAEKVKYLYDNKDKCDKMGKAGREYVEKTFSLEKCTDKYIELFNKVLRKEK